MRPDPGFFRWSTRARSAFPGGLLLLIVLSVVLGAGSAAAQWSTQSPLPTHLDVRGVGAPTANRAFVATDDNSFDSDGSLWESTDGGATWTALPIPISLGAPLNGLFFQDALTGWTFGNDQYVTTDGGDTWNQLPLLGSIYYMDFPTQGFGWAYGGGAFTYTTLDGGANWTLTPNGERWFDFADSLNALAVSDSGLHRSTDGGVTFGQVSTGFGYAVKYLSPSIAVGIVDTVFARSTDGGATWTSGALSEGRSDLFVVSATTALASGRTGTFGSFDDRVFRTTDAGQSWTDLGEPMPDGVWGFMSPGPSNIVGAALNGDMYRSTDDGATWTRTYVSPGPAPGFLSSARPSFPDPLNGYFGYGAGFVIKTTDGGLTWAQVSSGTGQTLNGLGRFPNGDMIAVGDAGTFLTSAGGGTPWVQGAAFTTDNLTAVQVLSATDVVAVDDTGLLHRSSDAGATWVTGTTSSGVDGEGMDFTTLLDGWVIGFSSVGFSAYHTTDGGDTWTGVPDFMGAYQAIDFEGTNGWAANVGGTYYRTTDSGTTWTSGTLPGSPFQVQDMDFWDANTGYAVAWNGYAARSSDAGVTWQVLPTPNAIDDFTDIWLVGQDELWIATNNDSAYYTANGGQGWSVMPIGSAGFGNFSAIAANATGDAWVAGFQGYIEHFAGPPPPPLNQAPTASFTFSANGFDVDFTDNSSDLDGTIVSWLWDFGDSTTSTLQNPSHTYTIANTYWVTLTVTDDDGAMDSFAQTVVAQPGPGGTIGDFTEVTPPGDSLFVTPQTEDFWVVTTAPGDYDSDGDLDIAVLGYYVVYNVSAVDQLTLFRNDGELSPTEWEFSYFDVPLGTLSAGASDMAWGDVDGDGDQDLAVCSDGESAIYRNDAGTLVMTDTVLPGYLEDNFQADFDVNSVSWADYDNDGDLDLLIPSAWDDSTFTYSTALMRNDGPNGTGGFVFTEETAAGLTATTHAQSAWADFDGDQDLDLLLTHLAPLTSNGFIRRYRNDGGGAFFAEDILDSLTIEHGESQWGDYDEDGDLDILVAGLVRELDGTYNTVMRIYRNDAESTHVQIDVIPSPSADGWFDLTAATWADYDSDGDVDILLCGTYNSGSQIEGRARIYDNDGTGTFTASGTDLPAPRASGTRGGTFSWLDLDQDLDLDYFIAGQYFVPGGNGLVEAQMHAYRNDVIGTNAAPTAPTALAANVTGGTVTFSWTAASDDKTPSSALTYDLVVREQGMPAADPHRLPEPGNISAATQWAISGLPHGSYTWELRAVDSAYNGGPVASGSFGVGVPTDVVLDPGLPRELSLASPFPNPFQGATTFRFALPEPASVKLAVYDVQGRLVRRLVNEPRAAGWHDVRWDARGVANGIYFVKLATPGFSDTKRVLLLR